MAKDLFHDAVKQALLKEQWVITADPLIIRIEGVKLEIDLAAEKVFAAEKAGRKIAVEIKAFLNPSTITEFHAALGQFLNYRLALQMRERDRTLYLFANAIAFLEHLLCLDWVRSPIAEFPQIKPVPTHPNYNQTPFTETQS